jgi:hypothetical protein
MITGHCECGRVRYEVDADIKDFSHCHCSQCRRLHGAPYVTFAGISRDKFRYVSGEADLKVYASSEANDRFFCAECGSNILVDAKPEPETLYLCMGTVDGDPARPEGYHAFVSSKAAWHEITDDLKQYDTLPPD